MSSSVLRNLAEPAFIISAFTAGSLINRRRTLHNDDHEKQRLLASAEPSRPTSPISAVSATSAGSSDLDGVDAALDNDRLNLMSRFLRAFPFLMEIWYWNLTYWIYQGLRAVSARMIRGHKPTFDLAERHAISILELETRLGLAVEQPLQAAILADYPWLTEVLARIYYSHISLGICFLIYAYACFPPTAFRRARRTIATNNVFAFAVLTLWRCSPPRLLPERYGFVDVLHGGSHGGSAWTSNQFQLTIAAMPSLHFGTSCFLAFCVVRYSPHRLLRVLAPLWPAAMLLTILGTANHFLLDALVGVCVPVLGWRFNRYILTLMPLQDKFMALFNLKYPEDPYGRESGRHRNAAASQGPRRGDRCLD